ncbi:Hypothetical protein AA314_07803 [Archangium gephyra]|uniref:Uncharacterized protein n=1 Tax=Archangium gephyra TaxID=48 RepID=A0AAC8THC6_9BACT|nr:Hypothetical protein AA314_07803 [Archangium gephyra]
MVRADEVRAIAFQVPHAEIRRRGGEVRYRIQWFNGIWSPDYYPGANDVDWVTHSGGYQRRVWSYFYDHTHELTFCN